LMSPASWVGAACRTRTPTTEILWNQGGSRRAGSVVEAGSGRA
jgi:hypothetical protein